MSRGLEYRDDITKIGALYDIDELRRLGGIVDYVVGTPMTKVYCLAEHTDPKQRHYLNLYKMGEGPLYSFFSPYHLVHFETPNAIARVALFRDSVAPALAGPVVEVCAVAKRDLKAGEILDDYGMYMTYGEAVNANEMCEKRYLPEGLAEGCTLKAAIKKDEVITYDDVELPPGRLADRLRAEQYRYFRGETWPKDLLKRCRTGFSATCRIRSLCIRSSLLATEKGKGEDLKEKQKEEDLFLATSGRSTSATRLLFKQSFTIFAAGCKHAEITCICTDPGAAATTHEIAAVPEALRISSTPGPDAIGRPGFRGRCLLKYRASCASGLRPL